MLIPQPRILIITDNKDISEKVESLLNMAKFQIYVAQGQNSLLLVEDGMAKSKRFGCHIAVICLEDIEGQLEIDAVQMLKPTKLIVCILETQQYDDRKQEPEVRRVVRIMKLFESVDCMGSNDLDAYLLEAIKKEMEATWIKKPLHIVGLPKKRLELFKKQVKAINNEIKDLLAELFSEDDTERIIIKRLDSSEQSQLSAAPRIRSVLFRVDERKKEEVLNPLETVIKIAATHRIRQEDRNYKKYIRQRIEDRYHARIIDTKFLWTSGVAKYTLQKDGRTGDLSQQLSTFYANESNIKKIVDLLEHFFKVIWKNHRDHTIRKSASLFEAIEAAWGTGKLKQVINRLDNRELTLTFSEFASAPLTVEHPLRWVKKSLPMIGYEDQTYAEFFTRTIIAHNDLHADNLLVSGDRNYVQVIDFERTGEGSVIQDFVQLEVDIVSRLAKIKGVAYLQLLIELYSNVQISESRPIFWKFVNSEAQKAYELICHLRRIAEDVIKEGRRTYLWGILLNSLYRASILQELARQTFDNEDRLKQYSNEKLHTLLLADVIVSRLRSGDGLGSRTSWWNSRYGHLLPSVNS